ncbi:MAG TPA: hypothetical protein VN706_09935 [Gemmatimonadaceae bacterium]|nr:hypothetical protein [Gemmatimonadaceae bacterium]
MTSPVSADLRAFLHEYVKSVEQAEILLLLFRTSPREWNAVKVGRELRVDAVSAARRLSDLHLGGLLSARSDEDALLYWYEGAYDPLVRELSVELSERPTAVISAIYAPAPAANEVRAFADAFRIRAKGDST